MGMGRGRDERGRSELFEDERAPVRRRPRKGNRRRGSRTPFVAVSAAVVSIGLVVAGVEGAGHLFATRNAAAGASAPNANCTLIVPANPLTAQGLASAYQLTATDPADGPCNEANANQTAFVQGAVINPATGQISVYNPLVVDKGTQPVAQPVVPALPAGGIVAVWFGFNGATLTLAGADQAGTTATGSAAAPASGAASSAAPATATAGSSAATTPASAATTPAAGTPAAAATTAAATTPAAAATTPAAGTMAAADGPAASATPDAVLQQAKCIAGENIGGQFTSFTQMGACNAVAFFRAANAAIRAGKLTVPNPGMAKDGQSCLTTRSFALIDQDQSDNVTTEYLANANGQTAQDTAANTRGMTGAQVLFNGSDNGLLDFFVDPALGCTSWTVPNLADNGTPSSALPLDELQAAAFAGRTRGNGPAALVPENDPMTLDGNGNSSTVKTNTYRSIVDMPALPAGQTPRRYCTDMESIQGTRLQQDVNLLTGAPSPAPDAADSLFTFLAMRLQQSFTNLNCQNFGLQNDVSTSVDANGVVVAACFQRQVSAATPGQGNPTFGTKTCPATASSPVTAPTSPAAAGSTTPAGTPSPSTSGASPAPPSQAATATPTASPTATAASSPTTPAGNHRNRHHHWWDYLWELVLRLLASINRILRGALPPDTSHPFSHR